MTTPTPVQSMLMFKQPSLENNEVAAHQDATYLHTTPHETCAACWVALEDADAGNGCLELLPCSHLSGKVSKLMVLEEHADGQRGPETLFVDNDITPSAPDETSSGSAVTLQGPDAAQYIAVPAKAGDAVIFDGCLWHRSGHNGSGRTRLAYTFHTVDLGTSKYSPLNWLQPGDDTPFESL
eukprot:TRINITY_DN53101_c0_g1_i2.p1 TRINITY_DN53101_c0_g1~~TRINITY_DN53101_c0_g1_i2.p1  ORF type:complete len:181 (+),score=25.89 TRINITY_DN53101_c0_g1_i2:718-1260(+)